MNRKFYLSAFAGLALILATGVASARETRVTLHQLPPAVQKTAQTESQGATVRGYVKDYENGHVEYEVETIRNGMTRDVAISASGQVEEVEQQVPLSKVPSAAMAAIRKGAKGGTIVRVEKVTTPSSSEVAYEAGVRISGRYHEVRVHANGSPAPESDED